MFFRALCACVLVVQLCLTLCDPMDCSPPGFSVHRILQAGILEWIVNSFSRESSWPRDWTQVSHFAGRFFTIWTTWEAHPPHSQLVHFCPVPCWFYFYSFKFILIDGQGRSPSLFFFLKIVLVICALDSTVWILGSFHQISEVSSWESESNSSDVKINWGERITL